MNLLHPAAAVAALMAIPVATAQSFVDPTTYPDLFGPVGSVEVEAPPPAVLGLTLGGNASGALGSHWQAAADGGASLSLLGGGLLETGAVVGLTGSSLEFDISNGSDAFLSALSIGASLSYGWTATATFDAAGSEWVLAPDTLYQVSFDLLGSDTLFSSTGGLTPSFSVELLDGGGNAVASNGGDTVVNILGLSLAPVVGNPVGDSRATMTFLTPSSVDGGAASLRFVGDAELTATALGLGTDFATISNLQVTAVPEPAAFLTFAGSLPLLLLRRRR